MTPVLQETPPPARSRRALRLTVEALGCGLLVLALEASHHTTDGRLFMSLAVGLVLAGLGWAFTARLGAHFNPALTFADALEDGTPWREVPAQVLAQFSGGLAGRLVAHGLCGQPLLLTAPGPSAHSVQFLAELAATFGLLVLARGCVRTRPRSTPFVVAAYVAATVAFTDSRALANPALVLARAASTVLGAVHPLDIESFVAAQLLGAALAVALFRWWQPAGRPASDTWTVLFHCPQQGVAEFAAALLNSLALPGRVRAVAPPSEAVAPPATPEEAQTLVVRLVPAGASPSEALLGEVWRVPAREVLSSEGQRELRAALRAPLHRFLRHRGWLRLYAVESPPRDAS
jgi:glycerol uptake facilitator-like aquaporin